MKADLYEKARKIETDLMVLALEVNGVSEAHKALGNANISLQLKVWANKIADLEKRLVAVISEDMGHEEAKDFTSHIKEA